MTGFYTSILQHQCTNNNALNNFALYKDYHKTPAKERSQPPSSDDTPYSVDQNSIMYNRADNI